MVETYQRGDDLYSTIASEVFNKPLEECGDGSEWRSKAKVILLATVYGTGANTLSQQLGNSVNEAKEFLKNFKTRFPVVEEWIKGNQKFVQKHGFVWMDKNQRKRRLPDARAKYLPNWYSSVFTQSTNAIIQGSSAIQTKYTLLAVDELCKRKQEEGKDWNVWCQVHDEILIEVPKDVTRDEIKEFENAMLNTYVFGNIPNKCDIDVYRTWGKSMSVDEWFEGCDK